MPPTAARGPATFLRHLPRRLCAAASACTCKPRRAFLAASCVAAAANPPAAAPAAHSSSCCSAKPVGRLVAASLGLPGVLLPGSSALLGCSATDPPANQAPTPLVSVRGPLHSALPTSPAPPGLPSGREEPGWGPLAPEGYASVLIRILSASRALLPQTATVSCPRFPAMALPGGWVCPLHTAPSDLWRTCTLRRGGLLAGWAACFAAHPPHPICLRAPVASCLAPVSRSADR